MWRITIFLILLLHIIAIPTAASDVILGTVVSVDRENGEMTVRISGQSDEIFTQGDNISPEIVKVYFTPDKLCEEIKEGRLVRVWGNFETDFENTFKSTHIRRGNKRGRCDPTGVRGRLGKRRGMGGRHHGGKGSRGK